MSWLRALIVAAGVSALGVPSIGCGGRQSGAELSYTEAAEALYAAAEATFARRDYEGARMRFAQVYQEYPYSQFATLSEMRVADCYFEERSYELARVAYERFVQFHPTHEDVPRAAYQVAMTYVQQLPREFFLMPPGHDRDLTQARNAHSALGSFLRVYADSSYVPEVLDHLRRVTELLTAHEIYVGRWYLRHDNALGAARRGRYVVETYPDAEAVPDALFLFAQAMLELGDVDQAGGALQRLATEYADSEAGLAAADYLQRLQR